MARRSAARPGSLWRKPTAQPAAQADDDGFTTCAGDGAAKPSFDVRKVDSCRSHANSNCPSTTLTIPTTKG